MFVCVGIYVCFDSTTLISLYNHHHIPHFGSFCILLMRFHISKMIDCCFYCYSTFYFICIIIIYLYYYYLFVLFLFICIIVIYLYYCYLFLLLLLFFFFVMRLRLVFSPPYPSLCAFFFVSFKSVFYSSSLFLTLFLCSEIFVFCFLNVVFCS